MRYHINAHNCIPDAINTVTYPFTPCAVNVKYSVAIIEERYTTVNGNRSGVSMPIICGIGPLKIAKLPMKVIDPQVKESANFWGRIVIMGKPTMNPNPKKTADNNKRAQKT
eukprot:854293_1